VKSSVSWLVTLTAAAEADYDEILAWTAESFGEAQAIIYSQVLDVAILALAAGPRTTGSRRETISLLAYFRFMSRATARGAGISSFFGSRKTGQLKSKSCESFTTRWT
jgi:plasmid stabilization system protein ParE